MATKSSFGALPEKEFYIANALYRITDADTISAWARDYADIRRLFIYGESLEFDALMLRIEELQKRVAQL